MSSGHLEVKLIDSDDQHHEELSDEQKASWTTVVLTEVQQDIESPSRKVAQDSASSPGANSNHQSLVRDARSRFSYRLNEVVLYLSVPISVFITVGIIVYYTKTKNALIVARVTSGYCTLFTLFVTGLLVYVHLCNYTRPTEQRYIIRILAMAPIYCVDSFIALWGTQYSQLIGLIRDTYESYVLYMFVYLLLEYLGGERNALESLRKTKPTMKHLFPFCCLQPIVFSEKTFFWWKLWLLQYVLIKPLATCVAIAFTANGLYHEGVISWKNSWVYISFVTNLSVMCAFSVVLYIYQATKELLFAHNPFGKFLAIKSVVFMIFWQSVALDVLVHMGWIRMFEGNDKWTAEMIASAFGNMLVCIEMALLAILHRYVFGFEHYLVHTNEKVTWEKVTHMLSQRDVVQNVVHLTEEGKEHLRRRHHEIKVSSIPEIETPNINEAGDKSE